jgi:hypothetical protein
MIRTFGHHDSVSSVAVTLSGEARISEAVLMGSIDEAAEEAEEEASTSGEAPCDEPACDISAAGLTLPEAAMSLYDSCASVDFAALLPNGHQSARGATVDWKPTCLEVEKLRCESSDEEEDSDEAAASGKDRVRSP